MNTFAWFYLGSICGVILGIGMTIAVLTFLFQPRTIIFITRLLAYFHMFKENWRKNHGNQEHII
jgi:hypothetical protein